MAIILAISFVITVILSLFMIPYLHRLKFGQFIRGDGPRTHLKKTGTPTMGGIIILLSFGLTILIWWLIKYFPSGYPADIMALVSLVFGFGLVGFADDYIKVVKKRSLGLRAYQKIVMQLVVCGIFCYYLYYIKNIGTQIMVPFVDGMEINVGLLFVPFVLLVILGTVNGVNLTDGLDGLASGVTVLVAVFFLFASIIRGEKTEIVSLALIGALLGFLLYNKHPAKVFMGDTGSLALGGYVAGVAILLKMEFFIIIAGIIYVLESLSVIIQVLYFKATKGKRIFKMAPLHHHFELCGMAETKIVGLFYVITAIGCLVGFLGI